MLLNNRSIKGGLLAAAIVLATGSAADAAGNNVASWVAKATKLGPASGSQSVTIAVHLSLANSAALKQFVTEVSSPTSAQYGRYLSAEEFAGRYSPATRDVLAVEKLLESAGMSNVEAGPLGAYVTATATVNQLRTTFHVSQDLYSYAGKTLRANKEDPTLPAALAGKILYVEGLDDTTLLRTPFHHTPTMGALVAPSAKAATTASVTPPPVAAGNPSPYCNNYYSHSAGEKVATLSTAADVYGAKIPWLGCGYTPQQIQAAYGFNKVKYDGTGVTVAIVDAYASPTLQSDGNRFSANHGLPKLVLGKNFKLNVPLGIYDVSPSETCDPYGWWGEEALDISAVHGVAPGAKILYVGARDCNTSLDIALFNTLYNHAADVVTDSWGDNGEAIAAGSAAAYDQALMAGAAQGMTVLFSSGDDGDLSALNGVASGAWPATSNYVTGVGGTTLELLNSSGDKQEYGWGTYRAFLSNVTVKSAALVTTSGLETTTADGVTFDDFSFYSGAGGGISLLESQPAYQKKAVPAELATTLNLASGYTEALPNAQRVSPDVAMLADPYTGYLVGQSYTIAGNAIADAGCTPTSATVEYCEVPYGGTSLASPLMAGVIAVMNQKRAANGQPLVGFANPLLYSYGSKGNGTTNFGAGGLNQIAAPTEPVALLRGYTANLNELRVITVNSVPLLITMTPFALEPCNQSICEGINEVFNFTSLSSYAGTPAGYNDVTGLGVPYVPKLILEE